MIKEIIEHDIKVNMIQVFVNIRNQIIIRFTVSFTFDFKLPADYQGKYVNQM